MRLLGETTTWDEVDRSAVLHALDDAAPMVRRAAVDALGRHPRAEDVDVLLSLLGDDARDRRPPPPHDQARPAGDHPGPRHARAMGCPSSPRSRPPT